MVENWNFQVHICKSNFNVICKMVMFYDNRVQICISYFTILIVILETNSSKKYDLV